MRSFLFAVTLCALAISMTDSSAQQQMAVPMSVKDIIKSPPREGQLLRVSGFLLTTGRETKLQDTDNNRKIILDFEKSSVPLSSLDDGGSAPVEVTGRMQGTKDNGKPIISVIGVVALTP